MPPHSGLTLESLKELIQEQDKRFQVQFTSFKDLLKEHALRHEQRFQAQEKATTLGLEVAEKARGTATAALEGRLAIMNEFRDAISDQAARFLTRQEYTTQHQALIDRMESENKAQSTRMESENKAQSERISLLERSWAEHGGTKKQAESDWGRIGVVIGMGFSLILSTAAIVGLFMR